MAAHIDINVIMIGRDSLPASKIQQLNDSVAGMTAIFAARGPQIGTVGFFEVPVAKGAEFLILQSQSDARAVAQAWSVKNDAIDLIVVPVIAASDPKQAADGWSPVGGPCNKKKSKGLRTPVVSLNGSTANSSNTFAHELGHFLGLEHCEKDPASCAGDPANFIKSQSNSNTGVTDAQATKMKSHCSVKP
jgi:hypothetical protein